MEITRVSPFSGKTHTKELDISEEQVQRLNNGELIQNVLGHLSASDREFIMTGVTAEEWDAMFPAEM